MVICEHDFAAFCYQGQCCKCDKSVTDVMFEEFKLIRSYLPDVEMVERAFERDNKGLLVNSRLHAEVCHLLSVDIPSILDKFIDSPVPENEKVELTEDDIPF